MAKTDYISYCPKCKCEFFSNPNSKDQDKRQVCGIKGCDGKLVHTKITAGDEFYIREISRDRDFFVAMNELRNKDIIAYKEKIAEYKVLYEKTHKPLPVDDDNNKIVYKQPTKSTQPQIKCPTCGSTNVKKISASSKAGGALLFGLFSKTAKSQFECKDCGYMW